MDQQYTTLDAAFWNNRWQTGETGWDIGYAAPAIVQYMQQYPDKEAAILIPGCGNAYEAKALLDMGYSNITLIDIAPQAVAQLQQKFENDPRVNILLQDFFSLEGQYDLMLEQTFFCAIAPTERPRYVVQAAALLKDSGLLCGLLFDTVFNTPGPPFGGSAEEYRQLFKSHFTIHTMEPCTNSIAPRAGRELFIRLNKKTHE